MLDYSFIAKGRNRICFEKYCPTKHILKIRSKFTEGHLSRCNFIEITLRHESSFVNLQHIFRTTFHESTY